jgi:hypothetical protein
MGITLPMAQVSGGSRSNLRLRIPPIMIAQIAAS